jgi:hypothetical protein
VQSLQELERKIAELENKLREKEGVIQAIPNYPVSEMEREAVRKRAQDFVDALMNDDAYLPVNASIGMTYLPDLPDLEAQKGFEMGQKYPVILRNITDAFWDACIEVGDVPGVSFRVAAIGTPGIGKTTSTPLVIRKLLKIGKTVVYHVRSDKGTKWIYEFIPEGDTYRAEVFPEKSGLEFIPSLRQSSTYYIVDPGKTKDNCDPDASFRPSVIVVAAPDERHWGGSSFTKSVRGVKGLFKYYPVWSEEEIRAVKYILGPNMSDSTLNERVYHFGGVPRNVFEESLLIPLLEKQKTAVRALTATQAQSIAEGQVDIVGTFGEKNQTWRSLVAFDLAPNDNGTFTKPRAIFVSPAVKDHVYGKHAGALWNPILKQG